MSMGVVPGAGVSSGGSTSGGSSSTVSEVEVVAEQDSNTDMASVEVSSYPDEAELELGLGLSIGGGGGGCGLKVVGKQVPRILTAKDLPSIVSRPLTASPSLTSSSSVGITNNNNNLFSGTKRTADSVTSPTGVSQVVGWPPIRAYRMNSLANQAKSLATGEPDLSINECKGNGVVHGAGDKADVNPMQKGHHISSLFVKVNMDGNGIGRKIDLNAQSNYESLALTLEEMFTIPTRAANILKSCGEVNDVVMKASTKSSKLSDGYSDYVLTYEDKEGDWMLVGDVPWGMGLKDYKKALSWGHNGIFRENGDRESTRGHNFLMFIGSVKRMRIAKTSEVNGLAQGFEE